MSRRVEKPWGHEIIWAETDAYVGKVLHIKAGQKLSYQFHERKEETLRVERGSLLMVFDLGDGAGRQERIMEPGDVFHVAPGTRHRMIGRSDVDVYEVSTTELDDVVRLEDAYGREGTCEA